MSYDDNPNKSFARISALRGELQYQGVREKQQYFSLNEQEFRYIYVIFSYSDA